MSVSFCLPHPVAVSAFTFNLNSSIHTIYVFLLRIYLHINYIVLFSHKYVCIILESSYIYYSMALATDEHGLIALFTCYLYYVVIQLFILFVFVYYTRACTCSIRSYLLYIYMYNVYIRMLQAIHFTDIIHVHSNNIHILTGNIVRGGWMLLEVNQHQKFQNEINYYLGITYILILFIPMWDIRPQCLFSTDDSLEQSPELHP